VAGLFVSRRQNVSDERIPITVSVTSWCHKFLTKRAMRLDRDRDVEAGRLLSAMCLQLIERADAVVPSGRTYTEQEFNAHMAGLRKNYESTITTLRARLAEREATDGK
jgi:hypothetical protein